MDGGTLLVALAAWVVAGSYPLGLCLLGWLLATR
jgi:hypothetical protein